MHQSRVPVLVLDSDVGAVLKQKGRTLSELWEISGRPTFEDETMPINFHK